VKPEHHVIFTLLPRDDSPVRIQMTLYRDPSVFLSAEVVIVTETFNSAGGT
jgi:hypothetical protein